MTVTEFLKTSVPFLQGLTDEDAHALAEEAEQIQFKTGQTIIIQGTTVDGLHVIAEGSVTVSIKPQGKPAVPVAELANGDVFGERSILEFGLAGATIKAKQDTLIFLIRQDAFLKLMNDKPALKEFFLNQIAERRKRLVANPKPELPPAPPK